LLDVLNYDNRAAFPRIAKVLTGTPIQILRSRSIELNFDNLRHYIDNDHCNL